MERTRMIVKGILYPILFGIVSLSIIGLIIAFFALAGSTDIPQEGVWYCEELQILISYDDEMCTAVLDGEEIPCNCLHDGDQWIYIVSQTARNEKYPLGSSVFIAEPIKLTKTEFVVKEKKTGVVYTFQKIEDAS